MGVVGVTGVTGVVGMDNAAWLRWVSRNAAALAASSLVSEGLTQRGVKGRSCGRALDPALELWLAAAWCCGGCSRCCPWATPGFFWGPQSGVLVAFGGVGAGEWPLSGGPEGWCLRDSESLLPPEVRFRPTLRSPVATLARRTSFSRESRRVRLGGRLSFARSGEGLGAGPTSAGKLTL